MTDLNDRELPEKIALGDPFVVGFLAWMVPGLGHLYQGRYFKSVLFFVCINAILLAGIAMGSYIEKPGRNNAGQARLQLGRNIWYSWRLEDKRLYFIPQAMIGTVGTIAVAQARYVSTGNAPFYHGIFSPPRVGVAPANEPTLNDIIAQLHSWYDIGLLFTVAAGLMNLLAIFDAIAGPVRMPDNKPKITPSTVNANN